LLFDAALHCSTQAAALRTGALGQFAMRERIEDFVAWANAETAAQGLPGEAIPPDPCGAIGLGRFRRTLAWHIARRPGGLVALAVQYGHLRTSLHLDESVATATAAAAASTAWSISKPPWQPRTPRPTCTNASRTAWASPVRPPVGPLFPGALVKLNFARKHALAHRHPARDGGVLHDNPHALLLCLYKRDRSLCERDGQHAAPSLDRCVPGCGNTVRTDQHAPLLRDHAADLELRAARPPRPLGDRLRRNAPKLCHWADEHDRTRFTHQETTASAQHPMNATASAPRSTTSSPDARNAPTER
jgi:hypothetical protein